MREYGWLPYTVEVAVFKDQKFFKNIFTIYNMFSKKPVLRKHKKAYAFLSLLNT